MTEKKAKRTRLSIQQKLEALRMLESGCRNTAVMSKFDIAERTVVKLKKEGPRIIQEAERNSNTLSTKTVRQARYPAVDDEVLRLIELARSVKYTVTLDMITRRALFVKAFLLERANLKKAQKTHLESFSASKGWAVNFVRRYGLRSVPQGESANGGAPSDRITNLQKRLGAYEPKHIFAVEETGLFFRVMPRRTYLVHPGNVPTLTEAVNMGSKDRITAYICTNCDGSDRVPVSVVGKSKNPRCFKTGHVPAGMAYFNNEDASPNSKTFRSWFKDVFLPFIRSRTGDKVALLVDIPGSYGSVRDEKGQVELIAFNQPAELDISSIWKIEYRKRLLRTILMDIETREERRTLNKGNAPGINGIAEGYGPHILDFMRLSKEAWESVSQVKIARIWRKVNILPTSVNATIDCLIGGIEANMIPGDRNVLMTMHRKLLVHLKQDDPMYTEEVTEKSAEKWLNLENDDDIRSALIRSSVCDMKPVVGIVDTETPVVKMDVSAKQPVEDGNSSDAEMFPVEMPSLETLYDAFRPAQQLTYSCHLPDASNHLNRALHIIRVAISKHKQKEEMKEEAKTEEKKDVEQGAKADEKQGKKLEELPVKVVNSANLPKATGEP